MQPWGTVACRPGECLPLTNPELVGDSLSKTLRESSSHPFNKCPLEAVNESDSLLDTEDKTVNKMGEKPCLVELKF